MTRARVGAVSYLNTRPLVYGMQQQPDLFDLRFDVPSVCATLLHEGTVDLGLVPAIEYLRDDYAVVPDVSIAADGRVESVAVFTRVPIERVRTLALDTSSRTSVALTRILCERYWGIAPTFTPADPDIDRMLATADAALVIGDPALEIDADAAGAQKIDLGEAWLAFTGLPFVFAMWTGRAGAISREHVAAVQASRDAGVAALDVIARAVSDGDADREARSLAYLRDTLDFGLGERERAGLARFHHLAVDLGLAPAHRPLRFLS